MNLPRRRLLALASVAPALGLVAGCSTIDSATKMVSNALGFGPKPTTPDWRSVTITAADDANQNSPVAIDLVFVREQALLDTLAATPATRWFTSRGDIVRSFPEGVGVISYELVPKQSVKVPDNLFKTQRALGVLAFANYPPPGEHRERLLLTAEGYLVQLGPKGFKAGEVKPAPAR
jgi:type VI secretion system protein